MMHDLLKKVCMVVCVALLAMGRSYAESESCAQQVFKSMQQLSHSVVQDGFTVWYATQGEHALTKIEDLNSNGIPDRIDDLLLQLIAAKNFYSNVLHLVHPLQQARYDSAETIHIFVLSMKKGNGLAFHEAVQLRPSRLEAPEPCGLRIYINNQLDASRNLTPAHELFHLYQYGYVMFKRSWYLEGMARLVETAFAGPNRLGRYMHSLDESVPCDAVMEESYSAVRYWWGLANRHEKTRIVVPTSLRSLRYSNGVPVFSGHEFMHGEIILKALEELEHLSEITSQRLGLPRYRWPTRVQGANDFDSSMCDALETIF
ncbi:hypothetical protein ACLPHM_14095 [Paenalcaligenes sp. Me131]|uniref:hypothetical protein n=1 Tax=Paenalcaligenes sp. Me131 TaxID=3392636 RepID=UPI003D287E73